MSLHSQERIDSSLKLLRELNLKDLLAFSSPVSFKGSNEASSMGLQTTLKDMAKGTDGEEVKPLQVTLRGLESMHNPSKTSILYSPPADDDRLYPFCQKLKDIFTEAEFSVEENRPLKLHATIVNTVYVPKARGTGGHGNNKARLTIDAREILEDFEEFEWMTNARIEKVAICKMGAQKNEDGEEEYFVEGAVEMP